MTVNKDDCEGFRHEFGRTEEGVDLLGNVMQLMTACRKCGEAVVWDPATEIPEVVRKSRENMVASEWYEKSKKLPPPEAHKLRVVNRSATDTEVTLDGKRVNGIRSVTFEHHVNEVPMVTVESYVTSDKDETETIIFDGAVTPRRDPLQIAAFIAKNHGLVSVEDPQCICGEQSADLLYEEHITLVAVNIAYSSPHVEHPRPRKNSEKDQYIISA